jgi:hypothetical protein
MPKRGALYSNFTETERRHLRPEQRLSLAILECAIDDIAKHRLGEKPYTEALAWIATDNPEWPFSFVRVCEVLSVDAAAVRDHYKSELALFKFDSRRRERGRIRWV